MNIADGLARLPTIAKQGWEAMVAEVRANPRARLGLIGIVLVLIVAGGLRLASQTALRQTEISALLVQKKELEALSSQRQAQAWVEADRRLQARLMQARNQLWSEAPVGVAHADFLAFIEAKAKQAELTGASVRLGETRKIGDDGQLTELRVSIFVPNPPTGGVTQRTAYAFLRLLDESPRLVYTRSLRVRFDGSSLLEGEFSAFVATARTEGAPETQVMETNRERS